MKKAMTVFLSVMVVLFVLAGCAKTGDVAPSTGEPGWELEESRDGDNADAGKEEDVSPEPEPDNDWPFDDAENRGMDRAVLDQLHSAAEDVEIYSIVVAKDGYIVDEYYKEGYGEESVFRLASCTKSFSGALVGIAIDHGIISGVDAKLSEYFPQILDMDDTGKQEITIAHLLEHTSGIAWYEWNGGTMFREFTSSENWVDFVLEQPMAAAPGTTFNYTTGGSHMLTAVLEKATGEPALDFAREHLFRPMGMDSVQWNADPQGITDGGNGIAMTARDAAKFGQLYLDGGRWKEQQILPEEWVRQSTIPQSAGSGRSGQYGYQWWIRPFGEGNYDTFYAMGHGGQFIFVVPELELVAVITSRFPQDTYAPWPYFTDYILAACE